MHGQARLRSGAAAGGALGSPTGRRRSFYRGFQTLVNLAAGVTRMPLRRYVPALAVARCSGDSCTRRSGLPHSRPGGGCTTAHRRPPLRSCRAGGRIGRLHRGQVRHVEPGGEDAREAALTWGRDQPLRAELWQPVEGFDFTDITYHRAVGARWSGSPSTGPRCATPSGRTPSTSSTAALDHARMSPDVGAVLLTGNGPSPKDGGWAFCSGGDQRIRGRAGYSTPRGRRPAGRVGRRLRRSAGCTSSRCSG